MGESETLRGDSERRLAFLAFLEFGSGEVSSLPSTLMTSYSKEGGLVKENVLVKNYVDIVVIICFVMLHFYHEQ